MNRQERRKAATRLGNQARGPGRVRAAQMTGDGGAVFRGYASVTEAPYEVGFFQETIARGAFTTTLSAAPDVVFLHGHDGLAYARTTSTACPLTLREDGHGLSFEAHTDPDRYRGARDLVHAVEDGLIQSCSFAFRVVRQQWNVDYDERRILEVDLNYGDVSVVTHPASIHTSVSVASSAQQNAKKLDLYRARAYALKLAGSGNAGFDRATFIAARRVADELRREGRRR